MDFALATPQEVAEELGRRVRRARLDLDLTQQTLADRAGLSRPVIVRLEMGRPVGLDSLLAVLMGLGRLDDLDGMLAPRRAETLDEALRPQPTRLRGSK